jgi:hypothetical protein
MLIEKLLAHLLGQHVFMQPLSLVLPIISIAASSGI